MEQQKTKLPQDEGKVRELAEKGDILKLTAADRYKTVDELFERSQPNSVYYSLLILSIFIVACGLLLGNSPIVIGGMLVTPVLTPILLIALGITVGELKPMLGPGLLILKSVILTIVISAIIAFAFGVTEVEAIFVDDLRTAILYFIVALTSGIAATFAWARREVMNILPGISIAVSLVPPLSLIGIHFGIFDFETSRFYLLIFLFNFVGILMGGLIVFSLLKFQSSGWKVHRKIEEIEQMESEKKAEKTAEKTEKKLEQIKKNVAKAEKLEEKKHAEERKEQQADGQQPPQSNAPQPPQSNAPQSPQSNAPQPPQSESDTDKT